MAKKSTQNTSTNQTQNVVTTPTNPAWVDGGLAGLGQMFTGLAGADPHSFVAGPDPLQTLAAHGASRLGQFGNQSPGLPPPQASGGLTPVAGPGALTGQGGDRAAQDIAMMNATRSGQSAPPAGQQFASGVTDPYGSASSTFDRMQTAGANTYNPAMSGAAGYNPVTGQASGYSAATGEATGYGVKTGQGSHYDPATYGAVSGSASLTGDTPQVQAASVLDNLPAYMSPYTNEVVSSTLKGYDDDTGRAKASQMLDLANDSTFGGSGGSILRSMTDYQRGLGRAQTEAQLRDQAFNVGAGLSGQDATRRQSASSENAGNALQRALADMQAKNTFGLANVGFENAANRDNATARNAAGSFNADNDQSMSLANLGYENTASRDNAAASNTFGLANLGARNLAAHDNADNQQAMTLANVGAVNGAGATNAGFRQQTNLANQGAYNGAGQFNAGQGDVAAGRQMEGARGLVGTANDQQGQQRSNIDTQSQIGQILQQLAQAQTGAPFTQAGLLSQLWGGLPLDLLHGGTANSTSSGTSNTKGTQIGGDAKFGWDAQKGFSFGFGG